MTKPTTELVPSPTAVPAVPAESGDRSVTARRLLDAWLSGRSPGTVKAYAADLAAFARWWLGPDADPEPALDRFFAQAAGPANALVLEYRNHLLAGGLASATVARRLAALRSLTKLANTLGLASWPVGIASPRAERRRDVRGPDESERKRLFRVMKGLGDSPRARRDRAIVALLFGLGLRRSEVVGLDLADLDFRASTVRVLGKGRREKVELHAGAEVFKLLGEWALVRGSDPGPLFTRTDRPGSPGRLTGEGLARAVARLGKAAGLARKLRPHAFRHAAVTKIRSGGITDRDAKAFSRHVRTDTLELYDDAPREAQARVSAIVSKELR